MPDPEKRIPVILCRPADDAFPALTARLSIGEAEAGRVDCGGVLTVMLAPGDYAVIAESLPGGELDGAALRLGPDAARAEITLRAREAAPGRGRVMIERVSVFPAPRP